MATRAKSSLELLYSISRELTTTLDLGTLLNRVLLLSIEYIGAERGTLIVLDEKHRPINAAAVLDKQLVPHSLEQSKATLDQGLAGWVLRNRQPVLIADTSRDERWLRRPDDDAARSGAKSAISTPLTVREQLVGVLTIVHPEPNFFTPDHLSLLQTIADQAGIAVYNARLYDSLQTATRRYHQLFDDSIDPILVSDWSGRIVEANRQAARATGRELHELQKLTVFELHSVMLDRLGEGFNSLRTGGTIAYESSLKNRNGEALPVEVTVRKVDISGGELLQWFMRDISERKALDRLREDLTAMVYHDLRSPLSNIISSLDMLESLLPTENAATLHSVFSIATRSTDRMQRLISSLLDINRLEAGQTITNFKSVEAANLVREASETIQPLIESKQLTLTVELPALPAVWVDEDMLRRVLINLLENACKFTASKGAVMVGGAHVDDQVQLWVQDTGPGIPLEARDQIFEKFTRLNVERAPKGLGLGLAFCRLAVQAHGGRIWVESEMGHGSRFIFSLPVHR
jgi:NtrC-family two-component system sensor histidine kinase KinB